MKLKEKAKKINEDIPAVFMALKSKDTPIIAKILAGVTIMYALSPIDLIPDFLPILGLLDDIIILPVLIALTIKLIPKEVFSECRAKSKDMWSEGKPKKWYYAVPIVLIWGLLIYVVVEFILR